MGYCQYVCHLDICVVLGFRKSDGLNYLLPVYILFMSQLLYLLQIYN